MLIRIVAAGRMKNSAALPLYTEYMDRIDRLGKSVAIGPCTTHEIDDRKAKALAKGWADKHILEQVPDASRCIALEEKGQSLSSVQFSKMLESMRDQGSPEATFVIGPAEGHGDLIRTRANKLLAFGSATWPHLLVRVMLAEQIYRSVSMMLNHPYHRE